MSGCSHGKTFKEPCTECQLVLAREGLAWALQSVEKYSKLIENLVPDASGPWIERGTGWAKIHNLPPTHLLNEPQPTQVTMGLKTNPELLALIERAKTYVMSPEEVYEQRRSFTRGMCPSNRDYTEWCEAVDRLLPPLSLSRPQCGPTASSLSGSAPAPRLPE